jgi:hypothetical protein
MAFLPRQHLATGELIAGALAELRANLRPVLIYLAVMFALGAGAESAPSPLDRLASFAGIFAYFGGLYLVFESMLRKAGNLPAGQSRRFFRFTGMGFLVFFGVLFAMYLFIIPGIIVGARWMMAPSILVATRHGAFAALGESWSLTRGNTLPIALAFVVLALIGFIAVSVAAGVLGAAVGAERLVSSLLIHGVNVLLVGLSVAVYRRLNDQGDELVAVFA